MGFGVLLGTLMPSFFLIDKHRIIILKRGKQEGNPKHTGSIHEKPQKQKAQGSIHSPTVN